MHELQMQKAEILERIQSLLDISAIQDLRWTLHGDSVPRKKRPAPMQPKRPLNAEDKAWMQAVVAQVSDPGLQEAIARVLEKHLQRSP
jgi:hypothetical protein